MKVVTIGGGLGAVQVMQGIQRHASELTGIIAVTDTGRSTGIVREFAQIPAPGDIRNALATLAREGDSLLARVMQHRIAAPSDPRLDGMAFGNLFIAALTQMSGSFVTAI
ncbi:MAG: 2-phospho-L-lactate transferase CofD family protein, partial [Chloroflexota bacterium]|nr:2-phospho-L-lactate transferase CofD family protein [Chloroflexota bacterium]